MGLYIEGGCLPEEDSYTVLRIFPDGKIYVQQSGLYECYETPELHAVEVPKLKWIWCEDSLPNEDEIAYTTMVDVSGERDISDKVLVCDAELNVYAAYFLHTGTPHKYYGTCLTNEYTLMHSRIGQAGWECTENKYGWSKRIDAIAWMPLPEPWKGTNDDLLKLRSI